MGLKYAEWDELSLKLAKTLWPGPLTIILPKKKDISNMISSGLSTVGLRMPNHPLSLKLIENINIPLCAPSANLFGKTSPTTSQHVLDEFNKEVPVLDGGPSVKGIESTIIQIENDIVHILRPGMITKKDLETVINKKVAYKEIEHIPGGLENHYQPDLPLVLFQKNHEENSLPSELRNTSFFELSLSIKPEIAARELYSKLREASMSENQFISLSNFENIQHKALRNRLLKASSFYIN